jgi:hypothetical protein
MNNETIIDECPICLDELDLTKNCIITECGHKFHCSCFMRHSAIQGFNCPYCRSITAEQQVEEDDEDDDEDDEDDDEEDIHDWEEGAAEEIENNEPPFVGIRRMFAEAEAEALDADYVREREREMADEVVPSLQYMITKLTARNYTLEDFVRLLLVDYESSELVGDHYNTDTGKDYMDAFGDIAEIIEDYRNSMAYHQLNIEANS